MCWWCCVDDDVSMMFVLMLLCWWGCVDDVVLMMLCWWWCVDADVMCWWCCVDGVVLMVLCWWCCVDDVSVDDVMILCGWWRRRGRRRRRRRRRDGARKAKTPHGNVGNNRWIVFDGSPHWTWSFCNLVSPLVLQFWAVATLAPGPWEFKLIRGSLVRRLSSYGRLSMASCLTIMATTSSCQSSCQPHHHVNHIIIKYSWDMWAIGSAWIHTCKHSRAQNLVFFSGI